MNNVILEERKKIASAISNQMKEQGLKQWQVAKLANVHQPVISDINTGKIEKISIESMIKVANAIDIKVSLDVKPLKKQFKVDKLIGLLNERLKLEDEQGFTVQEFIGDIEVRELKREEIENQIEKEKKIDDIEKKIINIIK